MPRASALGKIHGLIAVNKQMYGYTLQPNDVCFRILSINNNNGCHGEAPLNLLGRFIQSCLNNPDRKIQVRLFNDKRWTYAGAYPHAGRLTTHH